MLRRVRIRKRVNERAVLRVVPKILKAVHAAVNNKNLSFADRVRAASIVIDRTGLPPVDHGMDVARYAWRQWDGPVFTPAELLKIQIREMIREAVRRHVDAVVREELGVQS